MSNINFFRVLVSQAVPQNLIQCDIETVSFSGGQGIYEFEGNLGYNIGGITASFNAQGIPDRFELFWPDWGTKVADSLFLGDSLPNTTMENDIRNVTSLTKYYYDPNDPNALANGFVNQGSVSVNFSNDDIVNYNLARPTDPSDGNVSAISGSATQIGVMGGWPVSNVGAKDGNVRLAFEKTAPASKLFVRVTGCSSGTAWNMFVIGCPNSIISV